MRHRPGASLPTSRPVRIPHFGALALVALLAPFSTPAQTVREQVSVEVITVTVAARDVAGRPVRDLRAADLALSVDGKPVAIDTFLTETRATAASDAAAPAVLTAPAESVALAVGEDTKGTRTEPIRWAGTASRLDGSTFEATLDLGVPAGSFTWSLGVRDHPTGLVSFVLAPSAR